MYRRDRLTSAALLAGAGAAWLAVAFFMLTYDPTGDPGVLLTGALLLGLAFALTAAPVFWLLGFARAKRIAYRGDWWRAGRRSALIGLVVAIFVILRGQQIFSVPLALFVVAMAVLVEFTLSLRR